MKLPWFKRVGIFFIPVSVIGWIILMGCFAYVVYTAIFLNDTQHSVSDFFINLVFRMLLIGAGYSLAGYLTMRSLKD